MAAPVVADYVASYGGNAADAKVIAAFAAGEAWARNELGLSSSGSLDVLRDDNRQALFGYVADTLKLPKAQFGYLTEASEVDGLVVAAGDIGRRWSAMLTRGLGAKSTFA